MLCLYNKTDETTILFIPPNESLYARLHKIMKTKQKLLLLDLYEKDFTAYTKQKKWQVQQRKLKLPRYLHVLTELAATGKTPSILKNFYILQNKRLTVTLHQHQTVTTWTTARIRQTSKPKPNLVCQMAKISHLVNMEQVVTAKICCILPNFHIPQLW